MRDLGKWLWLNKELENVLSREAIQEDFEGHLVAPDDSRMYKVKRRKYGMLLIPVVHNIQYIQVIWSSSSNETWNGQLL